MLKTLLLCQILALICISDARAANCVERDYLGLKINQSVPPIYQEAICQLKLLLKKRTTHDTLRLFVSMHGDSIGLESQSLQWQAPLNSVVNELINASLAGKGFGKLAEACGVYFVASGKYLLAQEELDLLRRLMTIELQNSGMRL